MSGLRRRSVSQRVFGTSRKPSGTCQKLTGTCQSHSGISRRRRGTSRSLAGISPGSFGISFLDGGMSPEPTGMSFCVGGKSRRGEAVSAHAPKPMDGQRSVSTPSKPGGRTACPDAKAGSPTTAARPANSRSSGSCCASGSVRYEVLAVRFLHGRSSSLWASRLARNKWCMQRALSIWILSWAFGLRMPLIAPANISMNPSWMLLPL